MNEHVPGTKLAERLLTRPEGATMDEIVSATGGPKYNLLRTLESRGYAIRKIKEGAATRYFATAPDEPGFETTVTAKGQVTIPKAVRDALDIGTGSRVRFSIEPGGRSVVMRPATLSLSRLFGVLGKPPRSATVEDMDEGIRRAAVERYLRAVGGKRR